jgi:hypothetical protein
MMKPETWVYKYSIPRGYRNNIAFLVELIMTNGEYYELAEMLLGGLTATEISLIAHLLGITNNFLNANKYLNPLREQDPYMVYFGPLIQKKFRILILGEEGPDLIRRIQFPAEYWSGRIWEVETNGEIEAPCEIWIVAIPPNKQIQDVSTSPAVLKESFDIRVHSVESNPMYIDRNTRLAGKFSKGTGAFLKSRHPQPDTQWSKYLCAAGSKSFDMAWDDLFKGTNSSSSLPHIDATDEPHSIRLSENDPRWHLDWIFITKIARWFYGRECTASPTIISSPEGHSMTTEGMC